MICKEKKKKLKWEQGSLIARMLYAFTNNLMISRINNQWVTMLSRFVPWQPQEGGLRLP